eukprot:SAG22_NODE_7532_length_731_cov_0.726266_1_plen_72_part_01
MSLPCCSNAALAGLQLNSELNLAHAVGGHAAGRSAPARRHRPAAAWLAAVRPGRLDSPAANTTATAAPSELR